MVLAFREAGSQKDESGIFHFSYWQDLDTFFQNKTAVGCTFAWFGAFKTSLKYERKNTYLLMYKCSYLLLYVKHMLIKSNLGFTKRKQEPQHVTPSSEDKEAHGNT